MPSLAWADPEEELAEVLAQLQNNSRMSQNEALRYAVNPPLDSELWIPTAVRQEAARQLGKWGASFFEGSPETHLTLEFLHSHVEKSAIGSAAVDGIALCGIDRPSVQERLLQVLKNPKAAQDSRLRAIQWIRQYGVEKIGARETLLHATQDSHAPYVQLSACHALVAAGTKVTELRTVLSQLAEDKRLTSDSQSYAKRLARGEDAFDIPERSAGPALSKVCRIVGSAAVKP